MVVTAVSFLETYGDLKIIFSLGKVSYPFSTFLLSYQLKKAYLLTSLESPARTSGNTPTHKRMGSTGSIPRAQDTHLKYTVT